MSDTRQSVLAGLISGLVYSLIMAGFDYYEDQQFSLKNFVVNFMIIGLFIGFYTTYKLRKQAKTKDKNG
ncbi:hypothetical protein V8G61_09070 [Gaetbulibacter sp. M240]|uniref:hypothetical protein n=1 Tax=Gaetbulibacter sp. M240 TaxID=3126511 RepID=UPI00374FD859